MEYADGTNQTIRLGYPMGVAAQGTNVIFVSDKLNAVIIRMIREETNWVSTVIAGKPGVIGQVDGTNDQARFAGPVGIIVDANTNLFVADSSGHTIRRIVPIGADWVVSTYAGSGFSPGTANGMRGSFRSPTALAMDASGNLYVTDTGNFQIRKIAPASPYGSVTTIAGSSLVPGSADGSGSIARFSTPGSITLADDSTLYVADAGNHNLRKLTRSGTTWTVSTICGVAGQNGSADGTNSQIRFNQPGAISCSSGTNLWVLDTGNHTLRQVQKSGNDWISATLTGWAGDPGLADGTNDNARWNAPQALSAEVSGTLFVGDVYNSAVRSVMLVATNAVVQTLTGDGRVRQADGPGPAATFFRPKGMRIDADGRLYLVDGNNHTIRCLTRRSNGWEVETLAGRPGITGSADGPAETATFNFPTDLELDPMGNVYVADNGNSIIRRISWDGTKRVVTTIAGMPGIPGAADGTNNAARFGWPAAITLDPEGNIFVGDASSIRKIRLLGGDWVVSTLSVAGGASGTRGLVAPDAETLYSSDANGRVRKLAFTGTNWIASTIGTNVVGAGLCRDHQGALYVTDLNKHVIRKLTWSGAEWLVSEIGGVAGFPGYADGPGSNALFSQPYGIQVGADGIVYVSDNATIRMGLPVPSLSITRAGPQAVLSWPAFAAHYVLETSESMAVDSWSDIGGTPVTNGVWLYLTNSPGTRSFYRLRGP